MAWLQRTFGRARLLDTVVVLPTAEYFPDPYDRSEEDVQAILERVCAYMRVDVASVRLYFFSDQNPVHDELGAQRAAGLYQADRDHSWVGIDTSLLDDPLALVATMAHELGHVLLLEHARLSPDAEDHEPLTDLVTVFAGMGVVTANSVIREHYWHAGAVAGWGMSRRGYLDMPRFGYALAVFARERGEEAPDWARDLRGDVRSAFDQARPYFENPATEEVDDRPAEGPAEETDTTAEDADDDETSDAEDELCCSFCSARLSSDEIRGQRRSNVDLSLMICAKCRESIVANEQELLEQAERERQSDDLNTKVMRWVFIVMMGAIGIVVFSSCLADR